VTSSDPPTMSPALRALIDADNQRPGPSDSVRRGVYAAVGVSLGLAPVAIIAAATATAATTAATATAATTAAAGSTAIGTVAGGVSILGRFALLAKAPLASVGVGVVLGAALTTYVVRSPKPTTVATAPASTKVVAVETSKRVSGFDPPAAPMAAPAEAPVATTRTPLVRAHGAASPDLAERHATPARALERAPRATSALAEEQALLDPARAALAHGDGAGALSLLEQHTRRFPDGALAQEREAMAIRALVLTGDGERAQRRADAFRAHYPGSLLWPMIDATLRSR
jgi:hypothetical protein